MNKGKISWLAAALTVPALVFGAMASTVSAAPGIDPGRAADLIPILLLDDSLLDGGGWETTLDDFTTTTPPKNASCDATFAKMQALEKSLESDRAARGKVLMEQMSDTDLPMSVEVEMSVYKTNAPAEKALKELKTTYKSEDMTKCLVSQFQALFKDATGETQKPYIETKESDPAAAFATELKSKELPSSYRIEHYTYVTGNTLTQITISGPKAKVDAATVDFLVGVQVLTIDACDCGPQ